MEDTKKMNPKDIPVDQKKEEIDEEKLEKIKETLRILSKTVSLIKIYPPDHISVKNFTDELSERMVKFLEKYRDMEIDIEEFSFLHREKMVFHDDSPVKSLPFLFFKDGMKKILFYQGLKKEHIQEFLEIIRKYYESPPEEADIVSLLWEKDFAHIRCVAPDEYLEAKIGLGKEYDIKVDRETLQTGKIELSTEDKEDLSKADIVSHYLEMEPEKPKDLDQGVDFSSLNEKESLALMFMLDTNRKISPEEELLFLSLEMLYLEEKGERFFSTLDDLSYSYHDVLQKGNYSLTKQILDYIIELRQNLLPQSTERVDAIDRFTQKIKSKEYFGLMKAALLRGDISDYEPFFDYLRSLSPETILFLGEVYEDIKSPDFRLKAQYFLKEMGEKNYNALINLAHEGRPALTKEIIAILGGLEDKRAIQFLANFINSQDKSIKRMAIESLGKIKDTKAAKILTGFLADEDENLRIHAAQNLDYFEDQATLKFIMNIAENKSFKKKNPQEKQALLDVLGRSKKKEAVEFLGVLLKKSIFFSRSKQNETRLCAARALEKTGIPEALEALKVGSRVRTKKVRVACRLALERLSPETQKDIIL